MKSMLLFMAYYGKLPNYFDVWLRAVEYNETVNFCLITDLIDENVRLPINIKLLKLSYEEFKKKVQKVFPFKISLDNFGRISQFRPAFAYIFPEEVDGYEYWGFIECDLIPGNIRRFITDDVLTRNQKIFKLGHFQVFENNKIMNTLFMQSSPSALSYKFAYKNNILFFEELLGMHNLACAKKISTYTNNVFSDVRCYEYMFNTSTYGYPENCSKKCIFEYDKGNLFRYYIEDNKLIREETLYVHLQKRHLSVEISDFTHYLIIPNSFIENVHVDKNYFLCIANNSKLKEIDYAGMMHSNLQKAKAKKYKEFCWWLLKLIRLRIKLFGGVDLDGKQ